MSSGDVPTGSSFYLQYEFFISGIIWLPFSLFLIFLFFEHQSRNRYPQNVILLLLALGSVIRCIWYFLYWQYSYYLFALILNRIAILLQFSSLSILVLMWSRAVKVLPTAMRNMSTSSESSSAINKEFRILLYQRITIITNVIAWIVILCTLANENDTWYGINILLITIVCLIESIIIIYIGISTGLKLYSEMRPIYSSAGNRQQSVDQTKNKNCIDSLSLPLSLYHFLYKSNSNIRSLQVQKEVLRLLISTSIIVSFCFFIRCVAFLLSKRISAHSRIADYVAYPFLFYQIPEFFPTIVIAKGIAPPNSIIRRFCLFDCMNVKKTNTAVKQSEININPLTTINWSIQLSFYTSEENLSISSISNTNSDQLSSNGTNRFCGSIIENSNIGLENLTITNNNKDISDIDNVNDITKQEIEEFLYRTQSFG